MPTLFELGNTVRLTDEPTYKGKITRMIYVPEDEDNEEFQWLYLDDSKFHSQFPSYMWTKVPVLENLSERKKPYKCKI